MASHDCCSPTYKNSIRCSLRRDDHLLSDRSHRNRVWDRVVATARCPTCPTIVIDPPTIGDCAAGVRQVTFTVHINQPAGQSSAFQWDFGDGALSPAFPDSVSALHNVTQHNYAPGNYPATFKTILPQGCPDVHLPATALPYRTSPSSRATAIRKATGKSPPQSSAVPAARSFGNGADSLRRTQGVYRIPPLFPEEQPRA